MKLSKIITALLLFFSVSTFSQNVMAETSHIVKKSTQVEPLYVVKLVDGEVITNQFIINQIDTDWIKSITVIKDKDSKEIKQYGKRAENGLVFIYIKKEFEDDVKKILPH